MHTEERAAYRRIWGVDPPDPGPTPPPPIGTPVAIRQALDERKLQEEWQFARDRIELLMHKADRHVESFIYHPYLESLEILILKAWDLLGTPQVFAACLLLIEQMHEDAGAAAIGYEELKVALGLGGDYWLPIEVAARQLQYVQTNPVWQAVKRGENGGAEDAYANRDDEAPRQAH